MKTTYINKLLKNDPCFKGTFPCDLIPEFKERPVSMIINTDESNKDGQHWVSIILHKNRQGEYFDSYGTIPINNKIIKYLNNNCKFWTYNPICLQNKSTKSNTCGYYCLVYLYLRKTGIGKYKILSFFSSNLKKNDKLVKKIFNKMFK